MLGCSSLETLDLSPLSNIDAIPQRFLALCTNIQCLDFTPLGEEIDVVSDVSVEEGWDEHIDDHNDAMAEWVGSTSYYNYGFGHY